MYDFDLQMRFWKSATEAWFNYATAGMAAVGALANHVSNSVEPPPPSKPVAPTPSLYDPFDMMGWWTRALAPPAPQPAPAADYGASFFQFGPMAGNPWASMPWASFWGLPGASTGRTSQPLNPWASAWGNSLPDMMQAWGWPQASFNAFQMPMTAWLMAAGLPYSVAAPTARANTASMDAAAAAKEGMDRALASFRTDGGHAVAPILSMMPKVLPFLLPFWMMGGQTHGFA